MKAFVAVALAAIVLSLACSSDGSSSGADDESLQLLALDVGIVQSTSGAAAVYGNTARKGIELAARELAGDNLQIKLIFEDDKSTPADGQVAFTRLSEQKVDAIIGPTLSNVALEAFKISQAAGIPTLGATTTALGITDLGDNIFRTALAEDTVVPPVLQYVNGKSPVKNAVLVLDSTDAFSRSSADAMQKGLQAINGTLVSTIDVSIQKDAAAALAPLKAMTFDTFLVTPLSVNSGPMLKAIREAGFTQTVIGGNSFNTLDIVQLSGGAANNAYVGASWNPELNTTASKKFVDAYTKAYGQAPDLYAAQGYAATQMLVAAARKAGSTEPAALRTALASSTDVETIFGKITMSPKREAQYLPVIQQFRDGKLVVVQ